LAGGELDGPRVAIQLVEIKPSPIAALVSKHIHEVFGGLPLTSVAMASFDLSSGLTSFSLAEGAVDGGTTLILPCRNDMRFDVTMSSHLRIL
jgi:hypothetical protein